MEVKRYRKSMARALFDKIKESYGAPAKAIADTEPYRIGADILVIPPAEERNYYTLVTFGMGARRMCVPRELRTERLARAELVMHLPADWPLDEESLRDPDKNWPITLLRRVAYLPFRENDYLGWGHTVEIADTFSGDNLFVGAMLISPRLTGEEGVLRVKGRTVNFYELMPLYMEELDYKLETDANKLWQRMRGVSPILNTHRFNACDRDVAAPLDDGSWHLWKIHYKRLKTDAENAYNHLAAYFEWCLSRGFVRHPYAVIDSDFRTHVINKLDGRLLLDYFDGEGVPFTEMYFSEDSAPSYMRDLSALAEETLGKESKAEGYLFLPYNEEYRARIHEILDRRFEEWIKKEQT